MHAISVRILINYLVRCWRTCMCFMRKIIDISSKLNTQYFHKVILKDGEKISLSDENQILNFNLNFNIHHNKRM